MPDQDFIAGKVTLPETSVTGPALAVDDGGALYIAWGDAASAQGGRGDGSAALCVRKVSDNQSRVVLPVWSTVAPSLAFHNGHLHVAFTTSQAGDQLCVVSSRDPGGTEFSSGDVAVFDGQPCPFTPGLVEVHGFLHVAWVDDQHAIHVAQVFDQTLPVTLGPIFTLAETSQYAVSVAFHYPPASSEGEVLIAWAGTDGDHHLNFGILATAPNTGIMGGQVYGKQTYSDSPGALAPAIGHAGTVVLGWNLPGSGQLHLRTTEPSSQQWLVGTSQETTWATPALASVPILNSIDATQAIAWVGTDGAGHLNIGQVNPKNLVPDGPMVTGVPIQR